jgi:hypothetical protein
MQNGWGLASKVFVVMLPLFILNAGGFLYWAGGITQRTDNLEANQKIILQTQKDHINSPGHPVALEKHSALARTVDAIILRLDRLSR